MQNLPNSFTELLISPPAFVSSPFPKGEFWMVDSLGGIYVVKNGMFYYVAGVLLDSRKIDIPEEIYPVTDPETFDRLTREFREFDSLSISSSFPVSFPTTYKVLESTTKHKADCKMSFGRLDSSCPRCIELAQGAKRRNWIRPRY